MPSDLYSRIDEEEKKRVKQAAEVFSKEKRISLSEIVENKTIVHELTQEPRLWASSFPEANASLPLNSILYSKILTSICPICSCAKNPSLIKPYLERGIILPILLNPLSEYPADFAELIIQYPYIGRETLAFLRYLQYQSSDEKIAMCFRCYAKKWTEISKDVDILSVDEGIKKSLKVNLGLVSAWLYPAREPEGKLLQSVSESVKKKEKLSALIPLAESAWAVSNLRNSQIFRSVPQINQFDLLNIDQVLREKYYYGGSGTSKDRELALKALSLDYNPSMPIEDYLDVILPRKKRINSLVEELILSKGKKASITQIEDEIWEINKDIHTSKALETLTFTTNFVFDNAKILSSMLIGALIGYSSGSFTACGIGSGAGLLVGNAAQILSGKLNFKLRKYPKKTSEWIQSRIECAEEQVLATILAKDVRTVQVWSLQKKLKKEPP